jgi:hypothetical protein
MLRPQETTTTTTWKTLPSGWPTAPTKVVLIFIHFISPFIMTTDIHSPCIEKASNGERGFAGGLSTVDLTTASTQNDTNRVSERKFLANRSKSFSTKSFQMKQIHPSLLGYRYVIFPESRAMQSWDLIIILFTCYNAFWIPFEFGMSGGYIKLTNDAFAIINIMVDFVFFGKC